MACKIDFPLNNGLKMPALGVGTWRAPDAEIEAALDKALEAGYRHIDAAPVYGNEPVIGRVLKNWLDSGKVTRDELFIVTKLPPQGNRASSVEEFLKKSLADLQLDYIDLYLIHTPFAFQNNNGEFKVDGDGVPLLDVETNHVETWKEMERMVDEGLTKSIGVSNFNVKQIQRVLDNCRIKPVTDQVELHVYLQQNEIVDFCAKNGLIVTAYSPLGSKGIAAMLAGAGVEREIPDLMDNAEVKKIAERLGKTPAQVLLRYTVQRGVAAIPKSTNAGRLKQNIDIFDFELSADDVAVLKTEDQNVRVCGFEFFKGVTEHPEFPW